MANDHAGPLILLCEASSDHGLNLPRSVAGCRVREVVSLATVADSARALMPGLVLIGFADGQADDVMAVVKRLVAADRSVPVMLVTANGSEALAVAALRAGVTDYFSEPVDPQALTVSIRRHLLTTPAENSAALSRRSALPRLVGGSAFIRDLGDYLGKVAQRDVTVLITGETGTGKELAAAMIHAQSARRSRSFVSVNCAAIPEALLESELFGHERGAFTGAVGPHPGLLQAANRGTVLLDEIGDMGMLAQAKVLRAIESREVYRVGGTKAIPLDVRVLAATNQDVERAVDEGRFRKDLYFRLNVARVHLPPLRERRSDIGALLNHYVRELNTRFGAAVEGFSDEAMDALQSYDWPGNVRELKNLVEAIFICPPTRRVRPEDFPDTFRSRLQKIGGLPAAERQRLLDALLSTNWNKSQAAAALRWSRMTVYRKMAKYGVVRSASGRLRRES